MPKENEEGMQITPDLDQAMREGQAAFDGQIPPDYGAAAPLAPGKPGPDAEEEGKEGAEKKPEVDAEGKPIPPAAAAKGEEDGEEAPEKKEGDTPPGTAPRFKTHEEAEKGYRELQGKTTKAEQRARTAEDELDRVRNADRLRTEAATARAKIVDFAAERRAQALEEIDGLDPEAGDYRKQAAKILSQADIDIFENYQKGGMKPPSREAALAGEKTAGEGTPGKDEGMEQVVGYIQEKIAGEGLEKDDPLFWQYAGQAPIKNDKGEPTKLDDQIRWAVDQTKQYHNRIQAKQRAADEARTAEETRRRQAAEMPLGRGTAGAGAAAGGGKPPAEEAKPISLSDAIESALESRRL